MASSSQTCAQTHVINCDELKIGPIQKENLQLQPEFKLKQEASQQEDTVLLVLYCMEEL